MTHVRLVHPSFERADLEHPPVLPGAPSKKTLSGVPVLFVLSALLTAANFAGVAYITVLMAQLSDFSSRMDQFEQRVSERLETFNDGIHAQFDKLNSNLTGDTHPAATLSRRQFYHVSSRLLDNALMPPGYRYLSAFDSSAYGGGYSPAEDNPVGDRTGFGNGSASSVRIANFVRTELPNGKIVYRAAE